MPVPLKTLPNQGYGPSPPASSGESRTRRITCSAWLGPSTPSCFAFSACSSAMASTRVDCAAAGALSIDSQDEEYESASLELPFRACVGDAETIPLGIALRRAARRGDHHRQIASL